MLLSDLEEGREFDPIFLAQRNNFVKVKTSRTVKRLLASSHDDLVPIYDKENQTIDLWAAFAPIYEHPLPAKLKDGVLFQ